MDESKPENWHILNAARERLQSGGYALDLINWLTSSTFDPGVGAEAEVGDLFRALVLTEGWSVDDASEVYLAAIKSVLLLRTESRGFENPDKKLEKRVSEVSSTVRVLMPPDVNWLLIGWDATGQASVASKAPINEIINDLHDLRKN